MTIPVVVLAAGAGRRLGAPKALVEWDGRPLLLHVLARAASAPELGPLLVVTGAQADAVARLARDAGARPVDNPEWAGGGMLGSLLRGLDAAGETPACLVWPVDHPAVTPSTLRALVTAWRRLRPPVVVPTRGGRRGHPVLFDRSTFAALRQAPPDEGARAVVRRLAAAVRTVPVEDPGIHLDVDTPERLAALRRLDPVAGAALGPLS